MTPMAKTLRTTALASALLLGGCFGGAKLPPQLISLTANNPAPAGALGGGTIGSGLIVLEPETDRRIDVTRVPVQVSPSAVAYLKDAMWVEKPARQFRKLLAETIRAKSGRLVLEGGEAEAVGRDMLAGRLVDMGYDAASQSVVVRYDAVRNDGKGTVSVRRFESVMPGISPSAEAVGPALNRAANDVALQVADWIG